MNNNYEKLKLIYINCLELTVNVANYVDNEDLDNIAKALNEIDVLIKEANFLRQENPKLTDAQKQELSVIRNKISSLEERNIAELQLRQNRVKSDILKLNQGQKLLNAYKFNREDAQPILYDNKDS